MAVGHLSEFCFSCFSLRWLRGLEDLPNLRFTFPTGPVVFVQMHEAGSPFDGLLLRLHIVDRVPADQLFGLGERPVGDSQFPRGEPDARAHSAWEQTARLDHRTTP